MIPYKIQNVRTAPCLADLRLGGPISDQMETFFHERVRSDYAKNVIYAETEEQFRIRDDDINPTGMWRGEFWGKWVISACRVARYEQDGALREFVHRAALNLIATADPDGYIGTYKNPENIFQCDEAVGQKILGWPCVWNWNIWCRKYTLWGLLECYELCGDEAILTGAVRATDQLMAMLKNMGVHLSATGTFNGLPSGSIMKPVLILYRTTGDRRYLDFAQEIADDWERADGAVPNLITNALSMRPLHEWYSNPQEWAKAYELMSCLDGLLELYRVTGTQKYLTAVENMYTLLAKYEQNALFSVGFNDMFANAAEYQNSLSEPCDIIHWMRVCYELYALTGDIKYIDSFERAYYNPFLAAAFSDGKWGARAVRSCGCHMVATGQASMKYSHCCVNNMPRGFLNAAETFVMFGKDGVYINLYTDYTCTSEGASVRIDGTYLRDGKVTVKIILAEASQVHLRIPAWSKNTIIDGTRFEAAGSYVSRTLPAGQTVFSLAFDMMPTIRDFQREPEHFPREDFRVKRFVGADAVWDELLSWDRRSTILYGALLLTRSKLVGNTENEMFHTDTICGKGYSCAVEPIASDAVRNAFRVRFTNGKNDFETVMCDFATGTNRWVADDAKLFNIYL